MGQAQLLLIVLGVVLVGIAIIAGIQAYDQNNRKASVDALTHDAIRYANDLQLWAQKPMQFGGPENRGEFNSTNPSLGGAPAAMGYDAPQENSNGQCALSGLGAATATITCDNFELGTQVVVTVTGLSDEDITVTSQTLETTG